MTTPVATTELRPTFVVDSTMHSKKPSSPGTDDAAGSTLHLDTLDAPDDSVRLQAELAAKQDDYLRLAADFDNFKKRTRRDAERQAAAQKEAFIGELLPVLDNLERALSAKHSAASAQLQQGVTMTLQQLGQLLQRHGIEVVEDIGQPFNPHRHEAVSVRHDRSQPDQLVLAVTQRGYCRGEHVFRPAKVIVNDLSHSPGAHHGG